MFTYYVKLYRQDCHLNNNNKAYFEFEIHRENKKILISNGHVRKVDNYIIQH